MANEGSVSTGWSAEGKRPEFVGAKRAQAPLHGVCATIERTGLRIPPGSPFCLPDQTDLPSKGSCEAGRIFLFQDAAEHKNLLTDDCPC